MYLWSNPDLPHWQRILLGVVYLPVLFWWWLVGNPIRLERRPTPLAPDGGNVCPFCGTSCGEKPYHIFCDPAAGKA